MKRGAGKDRHFNAIVLNITTHCNRMCPGCIVDIPYVEHKHTPWEWIKEIAPYFQGLRAVEISGGEPTMHPDFEYITEHVREWFKPQILKVISNGHRIMDYVDILGHYDYIRISHYTPESYPGSKDNQAVIDQFLAAFKGPSRIDTRPVKHKLYRNNKNTNFCHLGINDIALIQDQRIYPCCAITSNLDLGIPVTANWRAQLDKMALPCDTCVFALPDDVFKAWRAGDQMAYGEGIAAMGEIEDQIFKDIEGKGYKIWVKENAPKL